MPRRGHFRVGHILLAIASDASSAAIAEAEAEAARITSELRDGADFAQMAVAHSAGQRAFEGGDLGWRKAGQLPSLFADQESRRAGWIVDPIRSASGLHIVKLMDRRGAGSTVIQQTRVRILVQPNEIRWRANRKRSSMTSGTPRGRCVL